MEPGNAGTMEHAQVEGTVSAVLFCNEEHGYTVLRLECDGGDEITAVGYMPSVAPGEALELEGSWGRHPSYGEQFKAEIVVRRMPVGEKAVFDAVLALMKRHAAGDTAEDGFSLQVFQHIHDFQRDRGLRDFKDKQVYVRVVRNLLLIQIHKLRASQDGLNFISQHSGVSIYI